MPSAQTAANLPPELARAIVQRMGETGQPPERGTLAVNVGTDEVLDLLRTEYLIPIRESGRNSSFKLVQATFGGGKTHFLCCLRELAWQEGFITALVGISPEECPFDDTLRIYQAVVRHLERPPSTPTEIPERGIDRVLYQLYLQRKKENGLDAMREWIDDELSRAPIESHAIRRAVCELLRAWMDKDEEREEVLVAFLRGEDVSSGELSALRIRERLENRTAYRFLRSLIQCLHQFDVPGMVLLFDEMDRAMSLSVKKRKAIGDNLRQMIDHCGQATLPSLLWVYAVPPEFMTTVVPEYPALEQRLRGAGQFSSMSPLEPVIDLESLPLTTEELFTGIGLRLLELFQRGRQVSMDLPMQEANVRELARTSARSALESGSRRTFVKRVVQMMHEQSANPRKLTEEDLDSASLPPSALAGEEDIF